MSDQEHLMQHKTRRVCDALLTLAGAQTYSFDKKMFVSDDVNTLGGL